MTKNDAHTKDFTSTSIYHAIWETIRNNKVGAKVRILAPASDHKRLDKAIRKRKWLEQRATGKDYGVLHSSSDVHEGKACMYFWFDTPLADKL